MTVPIFTDGSVPSAANLNALGSSINNLASLVTGSTPDRAYVPSVYEYTSRVTSVATSTDTLIFLDSVYLNNDNMWIASNQNLTINTAGIYIVMAQYHFAPAAGGAVRAGHILLNGTSVATNSVASGAKDFLNFGDGDFYCMMTPPLQLALGATLYLSVYQDSGAALNQDNGEPGVRMGAIRLGA